MRLRVILISGTFLGVRLHALNYFYFKITLPNIQMNGKYPVRFRL